MGSKRRRGESVDPIFAEEMRALEQEHRARERERLGRPPTVASTEAPPLPSSTLHQHDLGCWIDRSGQEVPMQTVFANNAWVVGRRCQRFRTFVIDHPASPAEARAASDAARAARP